MRKEASCIERGKEKGEGVGRGGGLGEKEEVGEKKGKGAPDVTLFAVSDVSPKSCKYGHRGSFSGLAPYPG